jgi:hypothetical protein
MSGRAFSRLVFVKFYLRLFRAALRVINEGWHFGIIASFAGGWDSSETPGATANGLRTCTSSRCDRGPFMATVQQPSFGNQSLLLLVFHLVDLAAGKTLIQDIKGSPCRPIWVRMRAAMHHGGTTPSQRINGSMMMNATTRKMTSITGIVSIPKMAWATTDPGASSSFSGYG